MYIYTYIHVFLYLLLVICNFSYPYLLIINNIPPHCLQLHCSQCTVLCMHYVYESILVSYLFRILFIFSYIIVYCNIIVLWLL